MRTRLWMGEHTTTAVQFRTDVAEDEARVWLHCNLGWIPIGNSIGLSETEAEQLAVDAAAGYKLTEASEEVALAYA